MRLFAVLVLLVGGACGSPVKEELVEYAGVRFRVVRSMPERLQLVWKDDQGLPYRSFDRVQASFAKRGKTVRFLMNAGIYEPKGIPSGLHIENGKTLHPLNLADAPGNFFLKPNGVFRIDAVRGGLNALICPSEAFPNRPETLHALQSGPLLLANGRRHPAFKQGSPNRLLRNGVGVDGKGSLVFAITDRGQDVNLWDFAGLFLQLNCRNALFLDGDISQMCVNPDKPTASNLFGAIFVIAD